MLAGGMVFLVINRGLPFLRIRSIPLAISAVALLHVYWVLCLLAYVLNGNFPCATEFWIMSIYLPLGIALYQATNTQLLRVATLQNEIASAALTLGEVQHKRASHESWCHPLAKWRSATATRRTMTCIAIGMGLQVISSSRYRRNSANAGSSSFPSPSSLPPESFTLAGGLWDIQFQMHKQPL